jgi:hypothetical protein
MLYGEFKSLAKGKKFTHIFMWIARFFFKILTKFWYSTQALSHKSPISNLTEIRPVRAARILAGRRRRSNIMKIMGAFRYYANEPENAVSTSRRKQLRLYHNDQLGGNRWLFIVRVTQNTWIYSVGKMGFMNFKSMQQQQVSGRWQNRTI